MCGVRLIRIWCMQAAMLGGSWSAGAADRARRLSFRSPLEVRVDPGVAVPATVDDVHTAARGMPHVTVGRGSRDNPVYQVGSKTFVYFRTPRPDAIDPETGERYDDVIIIWVASEHDKRALIDDPDSPYFTTSHFDGHLSVLVRASRLCEAERDEIIELVQDAWLSRASRRRANAWLADHDLPLME
jgi:hypothetical protein